MVIDVVINSTSEVATHAITTQCEVRTSEVNKLNIRMRARRNTDDTHYQELLQRDGERRRIAFTGMLAVGVVVRCACGLLGCGWRVGENGTTTRGHVRRVRPIRAHGWPAVLPARVSHDVPCCGALLWFVMREQHSDTLNRIAEHCRTSCLTRMMAAIQWANGVMSACSSVGHIIIGRICP
jgi:hypothetical protein